MKDLVSKETIMLYWWEAKHQNFVLNQATNVKWPSQNDNKGVCCSLWQSVYDWNISLVIFLMLTPTHAFDRSQIFVLIYSMYTFNFVLFC